MIINPYRFGGAPPAATTWDPAVKGANFTLSLGNTVATNSSSFQTVFATNGKSGSGKWQFELQVASASGTAIMGIADKSNVATLMTTYIGASTGTTNESAGYAAQFAQLYKRLSGSAGGDTQPAPSGGNGDICTITIDLGTNAITFYKNGVSFYSTTLPSGKTWFPAASPRLSSAVKIIPAGLTHPVTGFTDWG